jgi:hypothetical protein
MIRVLSVPREREVSPELLPPFTEEDILVGEMRLLSQRGEYGSNYADGVVVAFLTTRWKHAKEEYLWTIV